MNKKFKITLMALILFLCFQPVSALAANITIKWSGTYDMFFEVRNQTGSSAGANGYWVAADYYETSDGKVAYCLEANKSAPSGSGLSYSSSNSPIYDAETTEGLQTILERGYPIQSASAMGVSNDRESRYATAMALRMWMYRQKEYMPKANGVSFACTPEGLINHSASNKDCYDAAVRLYNYAVNKERIVRAISFSPTSSAASADGSFMS